MRRVPNGELDNRSRKAATGQLTVNPERTPLGVLAFLASFGTELRLLPPPSSL
jgi:hypothetical protein